MKVCLIGNNLTSLILAYILSKKKFKVEVYSSKKEKFKSKTRSLGITDFNLNFLEKNFKNISKKTNSINQIKVLVQNIKKNQKILFNDNSNTLFSMIEYYNLLKFIESKVKLIKTIKFKNIKRKYNLINLADDEKFDLVINCESSNILTKKFIKKGISKNYFNKAFTTIISHSKTINNEATQIFTEYGPIAFLPLSEKKTSVVFSFDINKKKGITNKEIIKLIYEFNPSYNIQSFKKIESFNLKFSLAKKYFHKNILFFGDTIHSIHPLAGQGFNMTIRDIIKLNDIIDKKIELGLSIDKSIYREFEKSTKSYNSLFAFGIDITHEFFKFNNKFLSKKFSENLFSLINQNKKVKNLFIKFANQGNIYY